MDTFVKQSMEEDDNIWHKRKASVDHTRRKVSAGSGADVDDKSSAVSEQQPSAGSGADVDDKSRKVLNTDPIPDLSKENDLLLGPVLVVSASTRAVGGLDRATRRYWFSFLAHKPDTLVAWEAADELSLPAESPELVVASQAAGQSLQPLQSPELMVASRAADQPSQPVASPELLVAA